MVNVDEYPLKCSQVRLDLVCFPDLFPTGEFGEHHYREVHLSNAKYINSKLQNKDFFLHDQKVKRELKAGIYNLLNSTRQKNKSVKQLLYKLENNDSVLEKNLSTILQSVRGTKQFWQLRSEVNAMIRDFGSPTLFLTFSCAEYNSADISESLKLANGLPLDSKPNIPQLCTEDPVTVTRQFNSKFHAFLQTILIKGEVLGKVSNHYYKLEYQTRGAPHFHVLLWIEGAPVIGVDSADKVLHLDTGQDHLSHSRQRNQPQVAPLGNYIPDAQVLRLLSAFQKSKGRGKGVSSTFPDQRAM